MYKIIKENVGNDVICYVLDDVQGVDLSVDNYIGVSCVHSDFSSTGTITTLANNSVNEFFIFQFFLYFFIASFFLLFINKYVFGFFDFVVNFFRKWFFLSFKK